MRIELDAPGPDGKPVPHWLSKPAPAVLKLIVRKVGPRQGCWSRPAAGWRARSPAREVYRQEWTGLTEPRVVQGALECLQELGWIRPEALPPVGGPRLLQNFDWDADDLGDACQDAAERVKHLARRIAHERKILRSQSRAVEANEALEQAATVASLALPSTNATAKILRYEAAIQRQLTQAMPSSSGCSERERAIPSRPQSA